MFYFIFEYTLNLKHFEKKKKKKKMSLIAKVFLKSLTLIDLLT